MGDKTMPNDLDPRIDQWYAHLHKGQRFFITAINEEENTVELQFIGYKTETKKVVSLYF